MYGPSPAEDISVRLQPCNSHIVGVQAGEGGEYAAESNLLPSDEYSLPDDLSEVRSLGQPQGARQTETVHLFQWRGCRDPNRIRVLIYYL